MFDRLIARESLSGLPVQRQLDRIGLLIDLSDDLGREEGTARALSWCDKLEGQRITPRQSALLEYFRANAWANRQRLRMVDADAVWDWIQPELQQQIFHLRKAAQSPGFAKLSKLRRCQIETNLANQLSTVGRFVDATTVWGRALSVDPHFGMALGNRGAGLIAYARALYDSGHARLFVRAAHNHLKTALSPKAKYAQTDRKQVKTYFASRLEEAKAILGPRNLKRMVDLDDYSLGVSRSEQSYRQWALRERLFLNPLNDLGPHNIAANDILSLPSFTLDLGETPSPIGFFNQMKQEYASGRWLLYEGINSEDRVHFSDRGVTLINTLDYTSNALAVEKVKAAYRISYSIFDKVAFFINHHWKLGIEPDRVYFKSIWYDRKTRGIRSELLASRNWPLRGLYWLSKDLFDPGFQDVMEPESQALYLIRNRLEHSYFKVHESWIPSPRTRRDMWSDQLAYSVQRNDFQNKTLNVFKLARAALIYLSLAMHQEELRRREGKEELEMPMVLTTIEDDWKM
jgi:hypothetical protein